MLSETDRRLEARYGAYAGFVTDADPILVETHGDAPADEVDRLLDLFASPDTRLLDLGCGAGQTLCRLAPRVDAVWGVDLEQPLLDGARERAADLTNVTLIEGDTTHAETVARLPEGYFTLVLSRRGPFLTADLMTRLTPDAHFVLEMAQDILGVKEMFGRRAFLPTDFYAGADGAILHQASLGLLPVSVKDYFTAQYFRDADHLAAFLATIPASLSNWWMEMRPYDPLRDRAALDLYCRYNTTARGVRLIQRRKVTLFHRALKDYYPVDGAL